MIGQLDGTKPFGAEGPMVDGAVRVSSDLNGLAILNLNENPAASVAHPAVAFDDGIVAVDFHLFLAFE